MYTDSPYICFQNAYKSLGGQPILRGINLSLNQGEMMSVVGFSGTGKSVLLRHIVGFHLLDTGSLTVAGQNPATLSESQMMHYRSKMGYLFQSGALLAWMNIFDNVALPLRERTKYTIGAKELVERVEEILHLVGLADAGHKKPSEISGGMCKRAGLARALVVNPELVLCDEPTSGLDPVMSRMIDDLLIRLRREFGLTVIQVTHDLVSAFRTSDKIAMIDKGEIVECGTVDMFKRSENPLVRRFIEAQQGV